MRNNIGCDYCKPSPYGHGEAIKRLIQQVFSDGAHVVTFISGDGLHISVHPAKTGDCQVKHYTKCCIIRYCPMCGREL